MNWKKLSIILSVIISCSIILGGSWKLYDAKADRCDLDAEVTARLILVSDYHNYQDIQRRRDIEARIWVIKKEKPNTWQNDTEYLRLESELKILNMKINAFYNNNSGKKDRLKIKQYGE